MIGRVEPLTICNALRRSFTDPSPFSRTCSASQCNTLHSMQVVAFMDAQRLAVKAGMNGEGRWSQLLFETGVVKWQGGSVMAKCCRDGSGCRDRKSTRLNSSHLVISYAVF